MGTLRGSARKKGSSSLPKSTGCRGRSPLLGCGVKPHGLVVGPGRDSGSGRGVAGALILIPLAESGVGFSLLARQEGARGVWGVYPPAAGGSI